MKRKFIVLFVAVLLVCTYLGVSASAVNASSGFYNIGSVENITIEPKSSNGSPKNIKADVDGDKTVDDYYANSDMLAVTYSAAVEGAYYGIILVEGNEMPTRDTDIYYIDQIKANSSTLEFDVFPKDIDKNCEMTLYISCNSEGAELISVPLNYVKDVTIISKVIPPSKIVYTASETFDITGMKVFAINELGEEVDVTAACTVDTTTELTVDTKSWAVEYNGQTVMLEIEVKSKPILRDFENITFSNETYTYNGAEQSIAISGTLPEGATVTYANEKGTNAGTYNATAVVSCEGYNTLELKATMTINKAPIRVKVKDVTIKIGAAIPTFDEKSYEITSGELFGDDKITGNVTTNCTSTSVANVFDITGDNLTAGDNYELTFDNGKLSVVDKGIQNVVVDGVITEKTYGDDGFKITVTPDTTSKLDNFTITSSDANVATVDASGNVTIKGAGITTLSVKEAGNAEYAAFEKTWTLTVDRAKVTITADNITKKIGQDDPKLTYTVDGNLYGEDKVSGELTRAAGEEVGKYDILKGTLAISDNYKITFNKGIFEIVDKEPQEITVADIDAKTYGDVPFKLGVTSSQMLLMLQQMEL